MDWKSLTAALIGALVAALTPIISSAVMGLASATRRRVRLIEDLGLFTEGSGFGV